MNKSKLIVIDGLDGSGKTTQLKIAQDYLEKQGYNVKTISFPDYNSESSALVKMYLNGEFSSDPNDVNAYAASSFYAVDRYASYIKYWKDDYNNGCVILAARYVSSNALHQMSKLEQTEWNDYLNWLYDYEYEKLSLPKADKIVFLDMPIEVSQRLLSLRYNGDESKKDIHESHMSYLLNCRKAALYAAKKLSWNVINCSKNGNPLSVEEISDKVLKEIIEVI